MLIFRKVNLLIYQPRFPIVSTYMYSILIVPTYSYLVIIPNEVFNKSNLNKFLSIHAQRYLPVTSIWLWFPFRMSIWTPSDNELGNYLKSIREGPYWKDE